VCNNVPKVFEGQTFEEDPLFKESITTYLEAPTGVSDYNIILTELDQSKFFRIIAYKESDPWAGRYSHFERLNDNIWKNLGAILGYSSGYVYPVVNKGGTSNQPSSDGGFGLMQLTNPKPTYEQIWNWKENINDAILRIKGKLTIARAHLNKYRDAVKDEDVPRFLRMDTYQLYNGGYYWKWNRYKKRWIKRKLNRDYAKEAEQIESNPPSDF